MIHSFYYQKGKPLETNLTRPQMFAALGNKDGLLWVDLESPDDFENECLVELFNFHDLAIEDCITDFSQPKVDDYDEYLFVVIHAVKKALLEKQDYFCAEQRFETVELDMFLGKNYLVTYHRQPIIAVEQIRDIVMKKSDRSMSHGSDLLMHSVLDHVVDNYQPVLDDLEEVIDHLEEEAFNNPPKDYLATIMKVRHDVYNLKKVISPQRDTINNLSRNPTAFIKRSHIMYFRDVYDHVYRIYGLAEGFHEIIGSLLQAYFSYSSHKLNEIMKRMTVLATLTMPAVIIASIYGMNFRNMPELDHPLGYLFSMVLMAVTSLILLIWMKWKKWI